uniref:Uncharacterized protein n=1 Tax=Dicentrarchus labrax TaxID=13489 RepID=A0A8C4DPA9_DICLA
SARPLGHQGSWVLMVTYPEVIRIHMDFLRVLHAQLGIDVLDVVHVLHSSVQPTHHCLTVLGHQRVSEDGGIGGEVAECCEVSLSPRIHDQKSEITRSMIKKKVKLQHQQTVESLVVITSSNVNVPLEVFINYSMPHLSAMEASDWTRDESLACYL